MSKPKPKSAVPGVYFRDDGKIRWEVKIRWVHKGKSERLPTKPFPVDLTAKPKAPLHISVQQKNAELWALEEWTSLDKTTRPKSKQITNWTLGAMLEKYLDDIDEGLIRLKSIKTAKSSINMLLGKGTQGHNKNGFPDLMKKRMAELKYEDFVSDENANCLQNRLKDRDGNIAGNDALRRVLTVIRGVFNRAQEVWEIEFDNPIKKIKGVSPQKGRQRTIDADEWDLIMAALERVEPATMDAIVFARYSAARRAEVVKLDWENIDFKKMTAHLHDTKSSNKEKKERVIPLNNQAREVILRRAQPAGADRIYSPEELAKLKLRGPIFVSDKGNRLRADATTQAWTRARDRAGVSGVRVHDLRHTRITELGQLLPGAEVARISGHTDMNTFYRYFNPDPAESARKIEAFERGQKELGGIGELAKSLAALSDTDFAAVMAMMFQYKGNQLAGK